MAKLYFCYSAMNAGKSTNLLQVAYNYEERNHAVLLYTAQLDTRSGEGMIGSRIGVSRPAATFGDTTDLAKEINDRHLSRPLSCILVDEAQFLTTAQVWQLARIADTLDVPVMCYGLRTDFRGELFPGSQTLLAVADVLREVKSICHCGKKATMAIRKDESGNVVKDGPQNLIAGNDRYESVCRKHWSELVGK